MRKLFKKALACCLVAAMALTCFVGALTVNAENALTGTIVAADVTVAADAASVEVPVTITSTAAINAAKINVAAAGYEVTDVTFPESADYYIDADDDGSNKDINGGTFLLQARVFDGGFTAADLTVVLVPTGDIADADVVITLEDVHAANWDEEVVTLVPTNGSITVKAAEPQGPVLDESLKDVVYGFGTNITNKFGVQFNLYLDLSAYDADSFEFRVTKNEFNTADFTYFAEPVTDVYTAEDTTDPANAQWCMYSFVKSFALYELQVPLTYSIYLLKDGVEVAYYTYAPVTMAQIATDAFPSAPEANKYMLAALLNVGTEVQELFAAKDITAEDSPLKTFAAPNAGIDAASYYTPYDSIETMDATMSGGVWYNSVAVEAAPVLHYEWFEEGLTAGDFYVEASYFSKFENKTVTFTVPGADTVDAGYGMFSYNFVETCLYDTDKVITFNVKKVSDDSVIGSAVNSVDNLLLENIDSANKDVIRALASFAARCRIFFPNY